MRTSISASGASPARGLRRAGVRPSKSKGQNFLVQAAIADRIVAGAALAAGDDVIEIGPGLGILSERILAHPIERLRMVELDRKLAAELHQRFAGHARAEVIESDFLALDVAAVIGAGRVKVIGNLPFNVASAILQRLCDVSDRIERMVLMFQQEVAARIRARPGSGAYGALSVFCAMYWEVSDHFRVAAGSFHPRPRVDAEVLVLVPRRNRPYEPSEEHALLGLIRACFSARRKTIRNALATALGASRDAIEAALQRAAIDPAVRAETLGLDDFVRITRALGAAAGAKLPE